MNDYFREIPRDLFNEGNLLKCYGQIYLNLEKLHVNASLEIDENNGFVIGQDQSDGSISLLNVKLIVRDEIIKLHRPLNSRKAFPLQAQISEDEEISVFDEDGSFTREMLDFLF